MNRNKTPSMSVEEYLALQKEQGATSPRSTKFSNVPTQVGDKLLSSKGEAGRYEELLLLQQAGEISNLRTQVPFALAVHDELICSYVADFVYDRKGERVVEDYKSPPTRKHPVYRIKKKLMLACLGIEIVEV